jgi:flagellar basal-body rod protein FlgB
VPTPINRVFTAVAHARLMDPTGNPLFALAERRLAWADRRQSVLAQNVANADTPGYQPRDVAPFMAALQTAAITLAGADGASLAGTASEGLLGASKPSGREPDGNAVSLDQELTKIADTDTTQSLVTAIYKSYLGLFRTALGQGGG